MLLLRQKHKNLKNFLLDEGMNIIMEELEIFNVFTKLFLEKKIHNDHNIELSDKLTKQLDELYKERIFDINQLLIQIKCNLIILKLFYILNLKQIKFN